MINNLIIIIRFSYKVVIKVYTHYFDKLIGCKLRAELI